MAVLLPLILLPTTCSGHTIYYVKPTHDAQCPVSPCLTLSEYAQQPHRYLISNATLVLLPGNHLLYVNFTVENVGDFGIYAQQYSLNQSHAMITCMGLVGFTFRNTSNVTVHGLTFNSCGKKATGYCSSCEYTQYLTAYGMSIDLGKNLEISNCSFQDSIGTALGVFYSRLDLKGSNSFVNNCRGCPNRNYACTCLGGGMFTNTSTLIIAGNTTFTDNTAEYGGGITACSSTLQYTGNITFRNNTAAYGGGINVLNTTLNFTGDCTFRDSSALHSGGGINTKYSTLNFDGNCTFKNNLALCGGGIECLHFLVKTIAP